MKVLLLGGTGLFGKNAVALFARENLITEIGLASRHFETAQRAASEIGDKARPVCLDIKDLPQLSSIAAGYDIIVNVAGPTSEVQVPALQAAIEAGVHYCDIGAIGEIRQERTPVGFTSASQKRNRHYKFGVGRYEQLDGCICISPPGQDRTIVSLLSF